VGGAGQHSHETQNYEQVSCFLPRHYARGNHTGIMTVSVGIENRRGRRKTPALETRQTLVRMPGERLSQMRTGCADQRPDGSGEGQPVILIVQVKLSQRLRPKLQFNGAAKVTIPW
jgi:hypothetical protein